MSDLVRVFVSSPSDVPAERVAVERVAARVAGRYDRVEISVYRWESGHYYSAHTGFQQQIEEIGGFDLVVGILWSRLGAPLPPGFGKGMPSPREGQPYPSGTAFEILEAIEIRRQRDSAPPDVFVYRKTAPTPSAAADDDAQQELLLADRKAVNAFIEDFFVNDATGFHAAFQSVEDLTAFEVQFEADLVAWLREHRSLGRPRKWRIEHQGTPFRGLDAFDAGHREVFFGRSAEIERARERLVDGTGFLLVDGASGTGKSSLVQAGLLPRMRDLDPDLRVAQTRPETEIPLKDLAQALFEPDALPELAESDFPTPADLTRHLLQGGDVAPILRALTRAGSALAQQEKRDRPTELQLVVLVDQSEALFSAQVSGAEQQAYGAVLEALVASNRVQIIATLRANAREAALAVPSFGRLIDAQQGLSLGSPTPDAFGEIVRGPAEAAGLAFERDADGVGLDEVLLREVTRDPDALPLLQFALDQLYDKAAKRVIGAGGKLGDAAEGDRVLSLTHADYAQFGGLSGAIGHQAEAALAKLSPSAQMQLASLVRALTVAAGGTAVLGRAPMSVVAPDKPTQELVEALVQTRVLVQDARPDPDGGAPVSELRFAHERVLRAWGRARDAVDAAAQYLRVRGDLTRAEARWSDAGRPNDLLLPSGLRLAEAEEVLAEFEAELDRGHATLRPYIENSGRHARRRQRITQAAAAIFALVAVAAGWFGYQNDQNAKLAETNQATAETNANEAEAQRQVAEENAERAEAETTRAETRLSALQRFKSDELATAAFEALEEGRYDDALQFSIASVGPEEEEWPETALSRSALTASVLQASHNFSTPIATLRGHEGTVGGGLLTPDASTAVTWSLDGTARVWDALTGVPRHVLEHGAPVLSASFAGDDQLVTTGTGQVAFVWNIETGERLYQIEHPAPLSVSSYNSDSKILITADFGGNIRATSMINGTSAGSFNLPRAVRAVLPAPDSTTILVAGGTLALLDAETLAPIFEFGDEDGEMQTRFDRAEFIEESGLFAAWSSSGHAVIVAPGGESVIATHNFETAIFGMLPFMDDGLVVFWTGKGIYRVNLETGDSSTLLEVENENALVAVERVPGFPWLAWASLDSKLNALSVDGTVNGSLNLDSPVLAMLSTQRDGRLLVSRRDGITQVVAADEDDREGQEGKIRLISRGQVEHDGLARRLSSTGTLALSGGSDGSMRIWSQDGGTEFGRQTHSGVYRGFHFSNNKLISWGQDPLAKIWGWRPDPQLTLQHTYPSTIADEHVSFQQNAVIALSSEDKIWLSKLGTKEEAVEIQPGFIATNAMFDPAALRFLVFSDEHYAICNNLNASCGEAVMVPEGISSIFWTTSALLLLDNRGVVSEIDPQTSEKHYVVNLGENPNASGLVALDPDKATVFYGDDRAIFISDDIGDKWIDLPSDALRTPSGIPGNAVISLWGNYLFVKFGPNGGRLIELHTNDVTNFPELAQLNLQADFLSRDQMVIGDANGGIWLVNLASGQADKVYETGGAVRAVAALGQSGEFAVVAGAPTTEIGIIFTATGLPRAFFEVTDLQPQLVASERVIITYNAQFQTLTIFDSANGRQLLRSFSVSSRPKLLPDDRLITRRFASILYETSLDAGSELRLETASSAARNLTSLDSRVSCQITAFSPEACENTVSEFDLALLQDENALNGDERGIGNMIDVMPKPSLIPDSEGTSIDIEIAANTKGKVVFFHNSRFSDIPAYFYVQGDEGRMGIVMKDGLVRSFGLSMGRDVIRLLKNTRETLTVFLDPETGEATEGSYVPILRLR